MTPATIAAGSADRSSRPWLRVAVGMFAVGWGANQFASLLLAYREHEGLSASVTDGLFGFYALGLIPALLVGGPLSDRFGRRPLSRVAVIISVAASLVLILGVESSGWLYAGRLLAGVASGAIFAPGTAWVKELSAPPFGPPGATDAGARRAAIALSAGFGLGPLAAGAISQWAPDPLVLPYVAHLVVIALAGALIWNTPESVVHHPGDESMWARIRVHSAASPRFRRVVVPLAPWVFTAASISITIGPALVTAHTGSMRIVFAGLIAGLTLGTGVVVQPLARRLDAHDDVRAMAVGLVAVFAGALVETMTAITAQPGLAILAALLFGAGYGFCLVAGLLETSRIAGSDELAALTAVYYALTYIGFAAPIVLAELTRLAGYRILLPAVAVVALITLGVVLAGDARIGPARAAD